MILTSFAFCGRKAPPPQDEGNFFDFGSIHFRWFWGSLAFVAEKPSTPRMREIFLTLDLSISSDFEQVCFLWQKSTPPPPGWGEIFWLWIYPFQVILSKFGFCGRKAPPPLFYLLVRYLARVAAHDVTSRTDISCIIEYHIGDKLAEKSPPQDEGKNFDFRFIHFRLFWASLVFVAEKPPPSMRENFLTLDLSISGNFEQVWFLWQKSPLQDEGKFFDFGSIHFRWFWASLVFVAEKSPPSFFCLLVRYSARVAAHDVTSRTDISCIIEYHIVDKLAEKPPLPKMREIFLTSDLSISGNFEQLWFLWQKRPPLRMRENFLTLDLSISGDFEQVWFLWQKSPPSFLPFGETLGSCCSTWHNFTDWYFMHHWISHWWRVGRKATPPDEGNFLSSDLSISGNFEQLWFLWQKSPPPPDEGNFSDFGSIHFRWFWASLLFVAEKHPPPRMRENFLTLDLSISGDFEQVWFLWQKSSPLFFLPFGEILSSCCSTWCNFKDWYFMHHWISHCWQVGRKAPPKMREIFLTSDLSISGNFEQLWFLWQKRPPLRMRENFLTLDLSISGDFEQVWFLWQKSPPSFLPFGETLGSCCSTWHNFTDWYFMHHWISHWWWVGRKATPPMREIFCLQIYPFQAILSNFGFCGRKAPPPRMREIFLTLDLSISGDFEQVCFLWQKSTPPPGWGKIFWLWIYPFQAILSKFGFCGWKAPLQDERKFFNFGSIHFRGFWATLVFVVEKHPPPGWGKFFWLWIYPFQVILSKLCFCGRKAPPPPPGWGKLFDFWSIHFRWFWASLVFVAEPPPPGGGKIIWLLIYPFKAILSKFGFVAENPPQDEGKFFDFGSIHFRWFWPPLLFVAEKPPPPRMREIFLTLDLSISGDFEEVWLLWQRSPPPPGWGKFFWLWIYPFQAILSKFAFCGRKAPPPPQDEGKFFDFGSIHFRWFWASLVFVAEKPPPLFSTFWWDTWLVLQHMT